MECFGTTDFDNNSRLITLSAIIISGLHCTSRNERVTLQVYDTCLQMFLFFGLRRKDCLTHSKLSSDRSGRPALFPLQRHPVVWNCWYQRLMLLGDGESLLNCRRSARWTETTDSCFTNCSTQNAFCSGVAIIALLRHRPREKRGVGLRMRMRTKRKHLLFRSMWETYFCVRFDIRNGRLKPFQSFWYTPYNNCCTPIRVHAAEWSKGSVLQTEVRDRVVDTCCAGYAPDQTGTRCTPVCSGCVNGVCFAPDSCRCQPGYGGDLCDTGKQCRWDV